MATSRLGSRQRKLALYKFQSCHLTCLRYKYAKIERFTRLGLNITVAALSSISYLMCAITLSKSNRIRRKRLLTLAFAAIMLCWILMVWPHILYFDFYMKGKPIYYEISVRWHNAQSKLPKFNFFVDYWLETVSEKTKRNMYEMAVDTALRGWRFSYGFMNTVLVLVLIRPFQEPLRKLLKWFRKKIGCSSNQ